MTSAELFSLKNSHFSFSLEPINITREDGFAEITECCFFHLTSEKKFTVFYINFDKGSLLFDNSAMSQCSASDGSNTFEFVSQSDDSISILCRLSFCQNGYFESPAYIHTATSRSPTSLGHCNSSNNIAGREAGIYIIYQNISSFIRFFQVDSNYAEGDNIISLYSANSNNSYLSVINCTSIGADLECIILLVGDAKFQFVNSNFIGNMASKLFGLRMSTVLIRNCYNELNNISNLENVLWATQSIQIEIGKPMKYMETRNFMLREKVKKIIAFSLCSLKTSFYFFEISKHYENHTYLFVFYCK